MQDLERERILRISHWERDFPNGLRVSRKESGHFDPEFFSGPSLLFLVTADVDTEQGCSSTAKVPVVLVRLLHT